MSTIPNPLAYLFVANYTDGTHYAQNPEDVSVLGRKVCSKCEALVTDFGDVHAECGGELRSRSSFADVDMDRLEVFALVRLSDGVVFEVNLKNGLFAVGPEVINIGPENFVPTSRLQLIFQRDIQQDLKVVANGDVVAEKPKFVRYVIGWKTVDHKGHKVERRLAVT